MQYLSALILNIALKLSSSVVEVQSKSSGLLLGTIYYQLMCEIYGVILYM